MEMEMDMELPSSRDTSTKDIGSSLGETDVENTGDGVDFNVVNNKKPRNGMEFETKEAAYSFYRDYAQSVGFGITIKSSRRSKKSGKFIDIKIACSRFGSKQLGSMTVNPRSCPKTDCKANMHIKRRADGKWHVYSFAEGHNHDICPDDVYYAIRGRNKQNYNSVCRREGMRLVLDEDDLQLLLDYLMLKQAKTPNFYYAIDFDKETRMKNVFWVDPQGIHDYVYFDDVVFFDTYYIKNKYKIPFVPILGVNHHFQYLLLGCALIGDETPSTFVWLMRTWVRAMSGRSPKVVITDYEKSMREATEEVFPDASHRFCLWHVYAEIHPNIGNKVSCFENFTREFDKCIYKSLSDEAFEKRWQKMVDKFELGDDEWIRSLYEDRGKWVPTYMRDIFLGGLCTIERSQSVSSFFDKYIHKETTFKDFIVKFKEFLHERYEEEAKAEFENRNIEPTLKSHSPLERQMSAVYTHAIFQKFQAEVLGIDSCNTERECEDAGSVTFQVDDLQKQHNFIALWNKGEDVICCSCRSFEYIGFLCRHAMSVLQISGVSFIKSDYILKRWTRNAKIGESNWRASNRHNSRIHRLNDLCKLATKLGEEGSLSREAYDVACYAVDAALKHCVGVNSSIRSVLDTNKLTTLGFQDNGEKQDINIMSNASKKKKASRKGKGRGEVEALSVRILDNSQHMEQVSPKALSLDNTYVPQQDMQGMVLGSRRPTISSYCGVHQSVQALGQLNSLSSLRDSFYDNQPSMQGLLDNLDSASTRVGNHISQHSLHTQGQLGFRAPFFQGCFDFQENPVNLTSKLFQDKHLSQ
ncbi:FAR1-RELATED SEQUENCE 2-like isoform X1 [Olea europaea subsp. europaea]|uniref:Protein FAR1-RELATED SEQUENCE n=1 Tax=Olea europaea subsp. europaea TaxID=158383 RepID=A0A8S0UVN2_OLEEU|nr:FAR1-RELATED SEQUENCE 2-like isoform X1 [Olea europaea subsp. europaea]